MTTFVINETQTHYHIEGDAAEIYEQCITCKKLEIKYLVAGEVLSCTENHVPILPVCKFKDDTGLTVKKMNE
jgi:hypothetical protein